jgi:small conductance mechanosensitive channel
MLGFIHYLITNARDMALFEDSPSLLLEILLRIGGALAVFLIGRWLAVRARKWIAQLMTRAKMAPYLETLAVRGAYYAILAITLLIALSIVGVPVSALVTSLGIVFVILGIALQESISNLAATVIFFIFQPFEVGDYIETGGVEGTVAEIQVFSTVLHKANGKVIVLPNGKIQTDGVVNYSKKPILRVDVSVGVSYEDDLAAVRATALGVMAEESRILSDPAPQVVVQELGDSSIKVELRAFVKGEDYWQVGWDLNERIHSAFPAAGISIPYPQLDVHMANAADDQ